ncbi:MAG: cell division protein ZapC, partial [Alteromonadales bacterium]|nr:cell division protein ZapC [Alteromonadales bacterium]
MDFIPKSNWQWVFDKQRSLLTLQMGDYIVDIAYKSNMLVLPNDQPIPFTVEDVARYTQLFECSSLKYYQPEFACKIILHILVVELFHKPIMAKSWLFNERETTSSSFIDPMMTISLTTKEKHESGRYLVIDDEKEFALCMLIDQIHQLTSRKSISQFQLIKVTHDKLTLVKCS